MKKIKPLVWVVFCVLSLAGCVQDKRDAPAGDLPPMLTINGVNYRENSMPVAELSDQFVCMGEITAEEANDTGLQGCMYYADKYISSFDEFYVYQECGTPIGEKVVDDTQRQWAYVKWVRDGFKRD